MRVISLESATYQVSIYCGNCGAIDAVVNIAKGVPVFRSSARCPVCHVQITENGCRVIGQPDAVLPPQPPFPDPFTGTLTQLIAEQSSLKEELNKSLSDISSSHKIRSKPTGLGYKIFRYIGVKLGYYDRELGGVARATSISDSRITGSPSTAA